MKYGLVYYRNTCNIGDDILSYAGKQFLPKVDYYIDRESLDVFIPDDKDYVATILNGWYLHRSYTFQPSPYLLPLFVGTHFSKDQMVNDDWTYIDNSVIRYLRQYEPIGCRDKHTERILSEKGILSYFSGCLTLTLPKFLNVLPNHKTILVDVPANVSAYIRELLPHNEFVDKTHRLKKEEAGADWDVREKRLIEYLQLYQGADLVITTRLHCALPCLALGTPVIFCGTFNEDYNIRIGSFEEYLHIYSAEEILAHKADEMIQHYIPKKSINEIADNLRKKCTDFIQYTENVSLEASGLPDLSFYQSIYIDRTQYMRYAIDTLYNIRYALQGQLVQDAENMKRTVMLCNEVLDENERLKHRVRELQDMIGIK